jgi:hypothetical protein
LPPSSCTRCPLCPTLGAVIGPAIRRNIGGK